MIRENVETDGTYAVSAYGEAGQVKINFQSPTKDNAHALRGPCFMPPTLC